MAKTDLHLSSDDYVRVADRIRLFYELFPSGRIMTQLVRRTRREVVVRAAIFRNTAETRPAATGWAAEREGDCDVNTVACLENTETSAVGRALANLGLASSAKQLRDGLMDPRDHPVRTRRATRQTNREVAPTSADPDLQRRADGLMEAMTMLNRAEGLGLSGWKVLVFRNRLMGLDSRGRALDRIARRLRGWLEHRFDRALEPS